MPAGFAVRGVIEGFYGTPWTHAQRVSLMDFLRRHGYNLYVYAPKDDPYHRAQWRSPYPPEKLAELAELAEEARSAGVAFCFAVSPGLSLRYADEGEVELLWRKLASLAEAGVRHFGLLFDDIPPGLHHPQDQARFASAAEAQAHVAGVLLERIRREVPPLPEGSGLPSSQLYFCPTHYRGDPDSPYLRRLGVLLDPEVQVFWTGPRVCSRELAVEHTRAVGQVLRRPPLYWDNYPVNDGMMTAELHIGPYTGRDPGLAEVASGVVLNPMPQYTASRWVLAAAGPYLTAPADYDPEAAWARVWESVARGLSPDPGPLAAALLHFGQANLESPIHSGPPDELIQPIARFLESPMEERMAHAVDLEALFRRILRERDLLSASLPAETLLELEPWLDEYGRWAEIGLQALRVTEAVVQVAWTPLLEEGEPSVPPALHAAARLEQERLRTLLEASLRFRTRVMGDTIRNLAVRVLQASEGYLS
ncbi:protein O-GlcNAcase [Limnochorda pilosa]|uniref:Beta-N-acetylglucosaminidase n=1 Tax=Limnochorda pilosa TaxID=1555112 RepID=A0A0K2SGN6_LIMPI|nr:protein O-GlcNAcase [Limnochorda pilosa]BAS26271.1 beta-N-acetylglucosaminidase [Limnochorda pilosa]